MRRIGDGPRDAWLDAVPHMVEAFDSAPSRLVDERPVALVDVGGQELRGLRVGARDDQRRRAHHVGRQPRGVEVADMRRGRDQHLAAEMAALLLRSELVLEVNARRTRLDEGLHDLERIERPAETGFSVGNDRREPGLDGQPIALRRFDLVGALQRPVDAPDEFGRGVGRIERLVGIHRAGRVGVRRHLPSREVDRLQPGAHLLHRLVAGDGAERIDEILRDG